MNKPLRALLSSLFLFSAVLLFPTETHAQGQALSETYSETPTAVPSMTPTRTPRPTSTPRPAATPTPTLKPELNPPEWNLSFTVNDASRNITESKYLYVEHGDSVTVRIQASQRAGLPVTLYLDYVPFMKPVVTDQSSDPNTLDTLVSFQVPEQSCYSTHAFSFILTTPHATVHYHFYVQVLNLIKENPENDTLYLTQGNGGTALIQQRNMDEDRGPLTQIVRSFKAVGEALAAEIGGASRGVNLSIGDINGDDVEDIVVTFGALENGQNVKFPNIVIPRDGKTLELMGHSFMAFPKGNTKAIQYDFGEIHTAIGNFTGTAPNQIAAAQGFGGNGVVRLIQYTGEPAPNSFKIIGQFDGLAGKAKTDNADGGVNLAAGDLDGDGLDELIVSQSYSKTSRTVFHVLDIDANGKIEKRIGSIAFPNDYNWNGAGVEMVVCDLNDDGKNEIIAAGQGTVSKDRNKIKYENLISVILPIIEKSAVVAFKWPQNCFIPVLYRQHPETGFVLVTAGEYSNCTQQKELIVATGSLSEWPFYANNSLNSIQILYEELLVSLGLENNNLYRNQLLWQNYFNTSPAFLPPYNPTSGAVHIAAGRMH